MVKYADFVSDGENLTLFVRISCGSNARALLAFTVVRNRVRLNPIRGIADDITSVCYRFLPNGWMDSAVFSS